MPFNLALVQMRVIGGAKNANLSHAESLIAKAAAGGAQVVLLPEAMTLGWTHPSARELADEIPGGESCSRLAAAARENKVYVCSGLLERAGDRVFNSAVLLSPEGRVLLRHRKINELDLAHDLYAVGDRLGVAETPLARFGLVICADSFADGQPLTRSLGLMGADVILSPSAWAVPADHDETKIPYGREWLEAYGPVARDFKIWIAGVSNVGWIDKGPWKGRPVIGRSLVMNPEGEPALRGPYGADAEAILNIEIEPRPRPAQGTLWSDYWRRGTSADSTADQKARGSA